MLGRQWVWKAPSASPSLTLCLFLWKNFQKAPKCVNSFRTSHIPRTKLPAPASLSVSTDCLCTLEPPLDSPGVLTEQGLTGATPLAGQSLNNASAYRLHSVCAQTHTHLLPLRHMACSMTVGSIVITMCKLKKTAHVRLQDFTQTAYSTSSHTGLFNRKEKRQRKFTSNAFCKNKYMRN